MAYKGNVFGRALCKTLGISADLVMGIDISIRATERVEMTVSILPGEVELQAVLDKIRDNLTSLTILQDGEAVAKFTERETE